MHTDFDQRILREGGRGALGSPLLFPAGDEEQKDCLKRKQGLAPRLVTSWSTPRSWHLSHPHVIAAHSVPHAHTCADRPGLLASMEFITPAAVPSVCAVKTDAHTYTRTYHVATIWPSRTKHSFGASLDPSTPRRTSSVRMTLVYKPVTASIITHIIVVGSKGRGSTAFEWQGWFRENVRKWACIRNSGRVYGYRGVTKRNYKLPEGNQNNLETRGEGGTLSNRCNTRLGGKESPEAQVYETGERERERAKYRDRVVKRKGKRKSGYNMVLRQRSWQDK